MAVRRWGLGAVVALLLAFAAMAQPAQAGTAAPDCPAGYVCGWVDRDFTGRLVVIDPAELPGCWGLTQEETFRSVWNATDSGIRGWISPACWGVSQGFAPGTGGNTTFPVQSFSP